MNGCDNQETDLGHKIQKGNSNMEKERRMSRRRGENYSLHKTEKLISIDINYFIL